MDGRGVETPPGRRLCGNCIGLAEQDKTDYREPDLRVLMGECWAEVEPELFAGTGKPLVSSEGFSEGRPGNRLKGRKPKRNSVKHPRPFDDPLPW